MSDQQYDDPEDLTDEERAWIIEEVERQEREKRDRHPKRVIIKNGTVIIQNGGET
jgi:hypothetical protein